jgi:hypothetical protein
MNTRHILIREQILFLLDKAVVNILNTLKWLPIGLGKLRGYRSAVMHSVIRCLLGIEPDHGRECLSSRGAFHSPEHPIMTTTGIDEPLSRSLPISSRCGTREQAS